MDTLHTVRELLNRIDDHATATNDPAIWERIGAGEGWEAMVGGPRV